MYSIRRDGKGMYVSCGDSVGIDYKTQKGDELF